MGPQRPIKIFFWAKMGPTIVHRTNIFYSSPLWTFLDSWNIIIFVRTQKCFLWYFGGPYGPPKIFFFKNGPHHHLQCQKLLYWANLAHSKYLGTSLFRFGLKIPRKWFFRAFWGSKTPRPKK